ncbi:FLYWCH zinc finger domain-containing protein [Phthorimaea operculella]|nr:FLYWCH zinc finger domain-containing protein [Phthorimaea operculella]
MFSSCVVTLALHPNLILLAQVHLIFSLYVSLGLIGSGMDCFASYCLSKQGKMGINVGGYRFRFNGCARNGKIRWRCSRGPWCKAALHTYKGRVVYIQSLHNCGPKPPVN